MSHRDYLYTRLYQELTSSELLTTLPDCPLRAELIKILENKQKLANNNISDSGDNSSNRKWWILASSPIEFHEKDPNPKKKDPVRVNPFVSVTIITQSENSGSCQFYSYLFENPGGNIPKSVINWFAKTAMPKGINQTLKAGREYDVWLSKN